MSTYVFDTTKGAGVPGLPHEITDEEAAELGVSDLLMAAIENGSYRPLTVDGGRLKATLTPAPLPKGEGKKSKE